MNTFLNYDKYMTAFIYICQAILLQTHSCMFIKFKYALIVIVMITISCDSPFQAEYGNGVTSMTSPQKLLDTLNKGQALEAPFLDSSMITLDEFSQRKTNQQDLSRAYRDLGWRNHDAGRFGTALVAFDKSLQIAKSSQSLEEEIETNIALGRLFNRFTDYKRSQTYFEQAQKLTEKLANLKIQLVVLHEIAKNELIFKNFTASEEVARAGLKLATNQFLKEKVNLLNALALSLTKQAKYEEAEQVFGKAIALDKEREESISGFLYGNLAECYVRQNRNQEAVNLLLQDYQWSLQDRSFNSAYGAALSLSEVYLDMQQPKEALLYYQIADSIRIIHNFEDNSIDPARLLLKITRLFDDKSFQLQALEKYTTAQEKWVKMKDKENREQLTALISINDALRTIDALKAEKSKSKTINLYLIAISILLSTALGFGGYAYFIRNKRNLHNQRLSELEIQSKTQQLTLLNQAKELQEKQILLQQAESARKENDLALLRSRTEHQALAKNYYNQLKEKMVGIMLTAVQNTELSNDKLLKQLERALLEVNLLETNPFIDTINQNEDGAAFITKLSKIYPELSSEELKLCTFLKLNMSTKEIAEIKSITIAGVNKSRNRIRKKFGLKPEHNLYEFLNQIT